MKQSEDNKFIPMTSITGGDEIDVREDIFYYVNQIVNVVFVGRPDEDQWVLIDAGMPKSSQKIISVAEKRYGKNNKPAAIILTHGHFDHVGSIVELVKEWGVPVFAHPAEFPFLTGGKSYPDPDPSVEGGLLAKLSAIYPHKPINIKEVLQPLPTDHSVPYLSNWEWIHTPGHSPGHVSFFRKSDKVLIAGDAFVTVKQDSLYKVIIQKKELNGPPNYLTTDWQAAWQSVSELQKLLPLCTITGHGPHMEGKELERELKNLADNFDKLAIPDHGRYVKNNE